VRRRTAPGLGKVTADEALPLGVDGGCLIVVVVARAPPFHSHLLCSVECKHTHVASFQFDWTGMYCHGADERNGVYNTPAQQHQLHAP